jgi:hypothetical protein
MCRWFGFRVGSYGRRVAAGEGGGVAFHDVWMESSSKAARWRWRDGAGKATDR